MIDLRAEILLQPIKHATEQGKLDWLDDPTGGFIVKLGENTVNLYEMEKTFPGTHHRNEAYTLRVLDRNSKVVDFVEYDDTTSSIGEVRDLYSRIRRQVRHSDRVLEDVLSRLNSD